MRLKYFSIVLSFATITSSFAASKNVCDDLIAGGISSAQQIAQCQKKFGVSDFAVEQAKLKDVKTTSEASASDEAAKKKENLEIKIFSEDDLFKEGFGVPFIAMRVDYRVRPPKVKRITEGNALCHYLGYEKVVKSSLSPEITPKNVDKKGLIIDTNFLGFISKEPEIYTDDEYMFTARKYVNITCIRRKDKQIPNSDDLFKTLVEDISYEIPKTNPPSTSVKTEVDNGSRSEKKFSSPSGYKRPDWATEDKPAENSSK